MKVALSSIMLLLAFLLPSWGYSQSVDDFIKLGNEAYNAKKYSEAVAAYVQAIQNNPKQALKAYRNCGHAFHQLEQWPEAFQFYTWYLEMSPEAKDARLIKEKIKRVKRKAKDQEFSLTEAQKAALEQLTVQLERGPYLTDTGGGAYASYEILLRTDYAAPQLAGLQQELADGLINESLSLMQPPEGQPMASLDSAAWSQILNRLSQASMLHAASVDLEQINLLALTATAWLSYLKGDYLAAFEHFEKIPKEGPMVAAWGRMLAGISAGVDAKRLQAALDALELAYGEHPLAHGELKTLEGLAAQALGDQARAYELLLGL